MSELVIGVLGGMGTAATIHIFEQYMKVFKAKKEWDRPRIVIDNRCTMPSRVRAYLYKEKEESLIKEMTESLDMLLNAGCNRVIIGCNTAHIFLPTILDNRPEFRGKIVNLVDVCSRKIAQSKCERIYLLASEGTIESGLYQTALTQYGIQSVLPSMEDYEHIRFCIECVKTNTYTSKTEAIWHELTHGHDEDILLGCTELPILCEKYNSLNGFTFYDPILLLLQELEREYRDE